MVDVDGNEYLDVLNNYTSLVHGHAFGPITNAVAEALADGSAYPAPHRRQLALAELLCARFPAVELVRFTNSGAEAALLAARIARKATGRARLITFEGAYHGTAPDFVDETEHTTRLPFDDLDNLRRCVDRSVAAVFVEPFLGSGGVIPASASFLREIQHVCREMGALSVIDEIQSLRNAYNGVHGLLGLCPDLVLMGKIIGGGLPVGAVGGRADLLELTSAAHAGGLMHSGTFNGNVLTCAAGVASMSALDHESIERLNLRATILARAVRDAGQEAGVGLEVTRAGSIMQVHLTAELEGVGDAATAALHLALLLEGVYAAPRGMLNLSTALTHDDDEKVVESYRRAFRVIADWTTVR